MQCHLHVRRTPSSPPLSTVSFIPKAYPFHSIHFVPPPPSAPRARKLSRRRPSRTAAPPRAVAPRTPPQLSSPRPTPLSLKQGHRRSATGAAPLPLRVSMTSACTGPPPTTPTPPRAPPEHRTPSFPITRPPTTVGHPIPADPLRPPTHRRGACSTVSFSPLQPLNRAPPLAGLLLDLFPHRPRRRFTGIDRSRHLPAPWQCLPCFCSGLPAHGDRRPTRMG
jgi:hypothetical protein